jgi:hypothetical protein
LHPFPYQWPEHANSDVELKPGGALWKYLLDLATIPLEDTNAFVQRTPYISPMHHQGQQSGIMTCLQHN